MVKPALLQKIRNFISALKEEPEGTGPEYEYCPHCNANLTLQKGYDAEVPFWICRGCGQMLLNPNVPGDSGISWICDHCGEMLNIQKGFSEDFDQWECTECGCVNNLDASQIFETEEAYQASLKDPYHGMSRDDIVDILNYREVDPLDGRENLTIVEDPEDGTLYVRKIIGMYDKSVYDYLMEHPVEHIPRLKKVVENNGHLIIMEEYVKGSTLRELLDDHPLDEKTAIGIARDIAVILDTLHNLEIPVIHRDIKPSNVIVSTRGETYLLDINAAKFFKPDQPRDTQLLGTMYYAAPEQFGYGLSASSTKTDIYALGIMLNEMITGKIPKEKKAAGPVWSIIEKCTRLEADERCTAFDLIRDFDSLRGEYERETDR